jgi:5'-3' exonuclease
MFNEIFNYVNRIFSVVRPRNLLFIAMDGVRKYLNKVAPRAKMVSTFLKLESTKG